MGGELHVNKWRHRHANIYLVKSHIWPHYSYIFCCSPFQTKSDEWCILRWYILKWYNLKSNLTPLKNLLQWSVMVRGETDLTRRQWSTHLTFCTSHNFTQIISVNNNSDTIIDNIPDELATEIPRALLLGFSNNGIVIEKLNKKKWKRQQVSGRNTETHTFVLNTHTRQ